MYDGVATVRLEGDTDGALALLPKAKALLFQVQQTAAKMGVGIYGLSRRIDANNYIYALKSRDVNIVLVQSIPTGTVPEIDIPTATSLIVPDFYSGMIYGGLLTQIPAKPPSTTPTYSLYAFSPTQACMQEFPSLVSGKQASKRLGVLPGAQLPELNYTGENPNIIWSQYTQLRPSMYSGKMKSVVQLVMGYGNIPYGMFADPNNPTAPLTSFQQMVYQMGVQVAFDYKFFRTHGVYTGPDGTLWLIEISITNGVLAMPLPMYKGPVPSGSDMDAVVAVLGGLPTGEAFDYTNLQANIAKGNVLQLLTAEDLGVFYDCTGYSTACGWAFNNLGTEAHNTAWFYDTDGIQTGIWYAITIDIGPLNTNRTAQNPAIATGNAALRPQKSGRLKHYGGRLYEYLLPFEFYEPVVGYLVSHDSSPTLSGNANPLCDTPVFVCFVEDSLKVVSYYFNPASDPSTVTVDTRQGCLYNNSWTVDTTTGPTIDGNMMYTNEIDDRKSTSASTSNALITSVDHGFDPYTLTDDIVDPEVSYIGRTRYFKRTTTTITQQGESNASWVAIPAFSREAFYYCHAHSFGSSSKSVSVVWDGLADPHTYVAWHNIYGAGGHEVNLPPGVNYALCGLNHSVREVVGKFYNPYPCSDFADEGDFLQLCERVYPAGVLQHLPYQSTQDTGTQATGTLTLVSAGGFGTMQIPGFALGSLNQWGTPSPDPTTGNTQYIACLHSALGENGLVYYSNLQSDGGTLQKGVFPDALAQGDMPTFIGVNGG